MKRPDKPVIVEVKRGGRKTVVKAVKPKTRTILTEPPPERPQNQAWRAADLLFSPKRVTETPAGEAKAPVRRVLRSLEAATPAPEPELSRAPKAARTVASEPSTGRRRGRPPKVPAAELRRPSPNAADVARALETIGRIDAHRRKPAAAAPAVERTAGPDLVERRRSTAQPLVATPKRRGRPPKVRPDPREGSFAERVWTSSKALLEDDAAAAPVPSRPAPAGGVPLAPAGLVAGVAASEGRGRVSFRARLGLPKPGERWKRRLRGHAR